MLLVYKCCAFVGADMNCEQGISIRLSYPFVVLLQLLLLIRQSYFCLRHGGRGK